MEPKPIAVIAGPTASGKTDLAIQLAKKYGGEIICADSRTVYKEMDIGTAKPSPEEQKTVPHHGLDLISVDTTYSAAEFQKYAHQKIKEIKSRGKIAFVVGGSGLYIDGLVYDYQFPPKPDTRERKRLTEMNLSQLQQAARKVGIDDEHPSFKNPRHLARAIERGEHGEIRRSKPDNVLYLGLQVSREALKNRLRERVNNMLEQGMEKEVKKLVDKYGVDPPGFLAPGYKAMIDYIAGNISLEEAKEQFISADTGLAKRQLTWLRRNKDIIWVETNRQAEQVFKDFLAKFDTIKT